MWKPRTFLLFLGAVVLMGILMFILAKPNEPCYAGHTLSYWLNAPATAEQPDEAVRAIRAVGTNAIPTLLRWINYEPTPWKMKLADVPIVYRHHGWARTLRYGPGSARAIKAFALLGTNLTPAIPALVTLMKDSTRPRTAVAATYALGCLGQNALPYLARALSDTNQPNRPDIISSICSTRFYGAPTGECIIAIVKATTDTDARVRLCATNAIRDLSQEPSTTRF
jgi:hypothetical protein